MAATSKIDITEVGGLQSAINSGQGNTEVNNLLQSLLLEKLTEEKTARDTQREQLQHRRETSVKQALEQEANQRAVKDSCSHRKENGRTRLGGQFLSDGRLFLTCQNCAESFWYPSKEGEKQIPQELMPPGDHIGGAITQMLPQAVGV